MVRHSLYAEVLQEAIPGSGRTILVQLPQTAATFKGTMIAGAVIGPASFSIDSYKLNPPSSGGTLGTYHRPRCKQNLTMGYSVSFLGKKSVYSAELEQQRFDVETRGLNGSTLVFVCQSSSDRLEQVTGYSVTIPLFGIGASVPGTFAHAGRKPTDCGSTVLPSEKVTSYLLVVPHQESSGPFIACLHVGGAIRLQHVCLAAVLLSSTHKRHRALPSAPCLAFC